jgi:hypothetical protein
MLSRTIISVSLTAALLIAVPLRLSARSCIASNPSSEQACQSKCCANKACCETSHERTGAPVQPLAKSGADQHNISAIPAIITVALAIPIPPRVSHSPFSAESTAHSPPPLALICIRLI